MKRIAIISLSLLMLLCSCSASGSGVKESTSPQNNGGTTAPVTTPEVTTDPDDTLTPMDVLEFVGNHEGTWTSDSNALVKIFSEDGQGYIYFAKWDAGGDFPCGKITSLTMDSRCSIHASLYVPEIEGDEFMEGRDAYTIECIIESFDMSVSVEIDGVVTVYTYDPNRQL